MNFGQMRAAVKLRLKLPAAGDAFLTDAVVNSCINTALNDISQVEDWPWNTWTAVMTFSTADGTCAMPIDCTKVHELVVGGNVAKHVGLTEFLAAVSTSQHVWTSEAGIAAMLTPIPTVVPVAKLWYVRQEVALAVDAAAPALPAAYHNVLVARASYQANVARRFDGDATLDLAEYTDGLKKMKIATVRRTGPRQIRSAYRQRNWATW